MGQALCPSAGSEWVWHSDPHSESQRNNGAGWLNKSLCTVTGSKRGVRRACPSRDVRDDLYTPGCVRKTSAFWCAEYIGLSQGSKVRKVRHGGQHEQWQGAGQPRSAMGERLRSQGPTWCPGLELDVGPGRGGGVRRWMTESVLNPYRRSLSTRSPGTSRKVLNPFPHPRRLSASLPPKVTNLKTKNS